MDSSQRLSDLLAGLSAKIAFHGREEKTCAEREAHFREQRAFHAAELERATRCHETLLAAAHTAAEINARPAPVKEVEELRAHSIVSSRAAKEATRRRREAEDRGMEMRNRLAGALVHQFGSRSENACRDHPQGGRRADCLAV